MGQFPIEGLFREPILVLEAVLILLGFEFGTFFIYRFLRERKEKNYMVLAWGVFFLCFGIMESFYLVSDFFSDPVMREYVIYGGYLAMGTGALTFTFSAEREMGQRKHLLSMLFFMVMIILIIDFFVLVIPPVYLALVLWIPFVMTLFSYLLKSSAKMKEYLRIYGFFSGFVIFVGGYAMTVDLSVSIFGLLSRLIGDILVILGISLISLFFIGLPSLKELDWSKGIHKLLLLQSSGKCIYDQDFITSHESAEAEHVSTEYIAGGLMGMDQMIAELVDSKAKLEIVDHQDKKIIFSYGDHIIAALIVNDYLEIYKRKLRKLIRNLEMIYHDVFSQEEGTIVYLEPIETLIKNAFS